LKLGFTFYFLSTLFFYTFIFTLLFLTPEFTMRPTSLLWLFSSFLLLANAAPIPADTNELTNIDEAGVLDLEAADVDRRDLDETGDLEKRQKKPKAPVAKTTAKPKTTKPKTTTKAKTTRPKTTKAKTTKAKTTAKPKTTKLKTTGKPKTSKAKTTAKPKTTKPKATAKPKTTTKPKSTKPKATGKKTTAKPKTTGKPTGKATSKRPSKTTSAKKPAGTPQACAIKKPAPKGAREIIKSFFEKRVDPLLHRPPQQITIKLTQGEFSLQQFPEQGRSGAVVYTVTAGPAGTVGSFAKARKTDLFNIDKEIANTATVGLLLASGMDTNECNATKVKWMIIKKVAGNNFYGTTAYVNAFNGGREQCRALLQKAMTLTIAEVKAVHGRTNPQLYHNDLHSGNILFDDGVTKASLIDWGEAKAVAVPADTELIRIMRGELGFPDSNCP